MTTPEMEAAIKQLQDASVVMAALEAKHARMMLDHADWLVAHDKAIQAHDKEIAEARVGDKEARERDKALGERIEKLVSARSSPGLPNTRLAGYQEKPEPEERIK
jgi:hypothetical protein